MTAQTELRPDIEISREPGSNEVSREPDGTRKKPHRVLWLIVLLIAMAVAGFVGVTVAANVTDPPAPTQVVYPEPNANDREGRIPAPPNANEREGRVPTTAQEPNANDREGRVPTTAQEPNANDREGRVSNNR